MSEPDDDARVLFFAIDARPPGALDETLPEGYRLTVWHPTWRRWTPPALSGAKWLVWALLHYSGIFPGRRYAVVQIWHGGELVHRSPVFPKYFRFPFMQSHDLQVGDTWTDERERGRGLAVVGLRHAAAMAGAGGSRLWYVTTRANAASVRVAERAGLAQVGVGTRRNRFGLAVLGQYRIGER